MAGAKNLGGDRFIPGVASPVGAADHWSRSLVHQRSRVEQAIAESLVRSTLSGADYARQAIRISESSGERERRALAYRRRMIMYDAWRPLLIADMQNRLSPEVSQAVIGKDGGFADISRNAAKVIWEEMSVLYKSAVKRSTPEDVNASAADYDNLLQWSKFHPFWQMVEVQLAAFNDLILWPTVTERRGRKILSHHVTAGDTCSVIMDPELEGDDPAVIVFFHHYAEDGKKKILYTVQTPEWKMAFIHNEGDVMSADKLIRVDPDTLVPIADNDPRGVNPFDGWPFVFIHKDPYHPWFWDQTSGQDLIDLTLKLGRRQTDDDYLWSRSSHKQLLIMGNLKEGGGQSLLDVASVLKFHGEDLTAQLLDWNVDFKARQDVANGEEIRAAASRGINPERMRRASYQSAEAAMLSERGLHERRERFEPIFACAEDEYYYLCTQLAKIEKLDHRPDPNVSLEVVYGPLDIAGDPAKALATSEARARLGYQPITDAVRAEHPSMTREQAMDFIRANIAELVEVQNLKNQSGVPENNLANRSSIDEQNGLKGPAVRDADKPPTSPVEKPA